ncbi:hypothetical protein AAFF_G00337380 [Aldrovandia affinis]|uniref:Uncharacterized protein n=1 Tax=Aldrovandia affinis TaxID=143900 RepID=A0AAD7WPC6_9TELE|nr:hypothetical protein AAFF_G00337380 [Aldrovandia affinis]
MASCLIKPHSLCRVDEGQQAGERTPRAHMPPQTEAQTSQPRGAAPEPSPTGTEPRTDLTVGVKRFASKVCPAFRRTMADMT